LLVVGFQLSVFAAHKRISATDERELVIVNNRRLLTDNVDRQPIMRPPMSAYFVYITAPGPDVAADIGRQIVEERLAACANILDGMTSIYRWEGELRQDRETVLILKTSQEQLPDLIARVRKMHPYDCPCVAAWPITAGNANYLHWIESETARSS